MYVSAEWLISYTKLWLVTGIDIPPEDYITYRETSCISRTKSQSLNVSCTLLQLPSLNPLKPGVKLRMKM